MRRALLLLCLGACAPPVVSLRPPPVAPSARDYDRICARWTRIGRVHAWQEMDTALLVAATLRSPEFQQAYAARYLSVYGIADPAEKERFLAEEQRLSSQGLRFLIRTAGHNHRWTDLDPHKGYWRIRLLSDDGPEVAPAQLEQARAQQGLEMELYRGELATPFARSFHVTFPAVHPDGRPVVSPAARRLVLRVAGPLGKTELVWMLKK
ncbi:MAG: hypothetical protein RMK29_18030 [Myxococcales bacterium]|nr:hypothetical protein [Myxococcota bacterium]MDW8283610.1 hypothetical protein [Myxococcales bacterium]